MEPEQKLVKKEGIIHGILFSFILAIIPAMLLSAYSYDVLLKIFQNKVNGFHLFIALQIICMIIIFSVRNFLFRLMKKADDKIRPIISSSVVLPTVEQEKKYIKDAIRNNFIVQVIALLFFVLSILYQNLSLFWIWLGIVLFLSWFVCQYLYNRLIGNKLRYYMMGDDWSSILIMFFFIFTWMGILELESWKDVLNNIALLLPFAFILILINIFASKIKSEYVIPKDYPRIYISKQKEPLMLYIVILLIWTIVLFLARNIIPIGALEFSHLLS